MGLFGRQARTDVDEDLLSVDTQEQGDIPSLPSPLNSTVIAAGVTLSGSLHGEGVVQVEGIVEGEIGLEGAVIVAPTGRIKGPVTANVVRVAGCIEGAVMAKEHMFLEKTGVLEGDVTTASLVVEDGGCLNGRSNMIRPEHPAAPAPNSLQFGSNYKAEEPRA